MLEVWGYDVARPSMLLLDEVIPSLKKLTYILD